MDIIGNFKSGWNSVMHPNQNTGKKMSIEESLKMYYMFSVLPVVLLIVLGAIAVSLLAGVLSLLPGIGGMLGAIGGGIGIIWVIVTAIVYFWILVPIGILVDAALYHLVGGAILKWFKGGYSGTVTAVTYQMMTVVSWIWLLVIPVIGALAVAILALWSLYVLFASLAAQHGTSKGKAFAVWLIWVVIGVILSAILGFAMSAVVGGLIPSTGVPSYNTAYP